MNEDHVLLAIEELCTAFPGSGGLILASNHVTLQLKKGKTLGLLGESGSGKSVTCRSIIGLVPKPGEVISGKIEFDGRDLLEIDSKEWRKIRGQQIGMVFQDPMSSLNPVYKVGEQIVEVLRNKLRMRRREATTEAISLLKKVGIASPEQQFHSYPHELSGGMRQRVLIACAIATRPSLLIADEPTTALDVTVQAQILSLLRELKLEIEMAMILISHDFGVVAQYCDEVAVMYGGFIVEYVTVINVFEKPKHQYTRALLRSIPKLSGHTDRELLPIQGQPPDLGRLTSGCPFAPRCDQSQAECSEVGMTLAEVHTNHLTACPF